MACCRFALVVALFLACTVATRAEESATQLSLAPDAGMVAALLAPAAQETAPAAKSAFAVDTWTFQTYGSATISDGRNNGEVYAGHVGLGYHFYDGLSVNFEAVGAFINVDRNDAASGGRAGAGGLDLLLRWHFLRGDGWSLYADGGAGILQSSVSFPSDGTHFNFTPQAGVGATLRLCDNLRLMGGARWFHLSNARLPHGALRNPGYDSFMVYLGVMVPF